MNINGGKKITIQEFNQLLRATGLGAHGGKTYSSACADLDGLSFPANRYLRVESARILRKNQSSTERRER